MKLIRFVQALVRDEEDASIRSITLGFAFPVLRMRCRAASG